MRWVTVGDSNAAIAARLHVSAGTVKNTWTTCTQNWVFVDEGALTAFVLDITVD